MTSVSHKKNAQREEFEDWTLIVGALNSAYLG